MSNPTPPKMIQVTINGKVIDVEDGLTIMQVLHKVGQTVPYFCYHPRLSIAGNCRMCLVEIEKTPKPVASCAMPIANGMVIHTESDMVKKARENVLEILLMNHPLDCPICDQGGECDLQDITYHYGKDHSDFKGCKRAVPDKDFGPLIETAMTRCIHCTRCVRFLEEVAGTSELGGFGRGEHMEIDTTLEAGISTELSGNLVDICPVGALTSKPYSYRARPWDLTHTETIDVMDAVGSNIVVDTKGWEVLRITPKFNDEINEEWISDKTRFACDGLKYNRLDHAYIKEGMEVNKVTIDRALEKAETLFKKSKTIGFLVGDLVEAESMVIIKDLVKSLSDYKLAFHESRLKGAKFDLNAISSYLFNTTIAQTEESDLILIVGSNPRLEAPIINYKIRKAFLQNKAKIYVIGEEVNLNYNAEFLGDDPIILEDILTGKHEISKILKQATKPLIVLGEGVLERQDGDAIIHISQKIAEKYNMVRDDWNGFNVLHTKASRVAALDLGIVCNDWKKDALDEIYNLSKQDKLDLLYLVGVDDLDFSRLKNTKIIYQGHHGDLGAENADVILPGAAYTEKNGIYINTEGRVQMARAAIRPPGEAIEDYNLLMKLAEKLEISLKYANYKELQGYISKKYSHLSNIGKINKPEWKVSTKAGEISSKGFKNVIDNFYITNVIAKNSPTMQKCTSHFLKIED